MDEDLKLQIKKVKETFDKWIVGSIDICFESIKQSDGAGTPLTCFILVSCAIDNISGFYSGRYKNKPGEVGEQYKQFIERYMPKYESEAIWIYLRNALVHNYTLLGPFALTHNHTELHNTEVFPVLNSKGKKKIINFEDFLQDFKNGINKYFKELNKSEDLQYKFKKRLDYIGIAGVVPINLLNKKDLTE